MVQKIYIDVRVTSTAPHHLHKTTFHLSSISNIKPLSNQTTNISPIIASTTFGQDRSSNMYRVAARGGPRVCRSSCAQPSRSMFTASPFFPHSGLSPFGAFGNDVFRLIDSATADLLPQSARHTVRRNFTPRFDVRENAAGTSYELQGELPGFDQKDLDIEFVDERTLVIKGRSASEQTAGQNPTIASENNTQKSVTAEEAASDQDSQKSAKYQPASVEDEYVDAGAESAEGTVSKTPTSTAAEESQPLEASKKGEPEPDFKYWISERSVGEFERRFAFPGRIDQDQVKASLKNGILSIVVPKLVEQGTRKISVQ